MHGAERPKRTARRLGLPVSRDARFPVLACSPIGWGLECLAHTWQWNARLSARLQALARVLWWAVQGGAVAYLTLIVLMLLLFRLVGEDCWLLWPFLYMPPQLALLPLAVLLPLGLLLCPLSLPVDAATVAVIVFAYMGFAFRLGGRSDPGPRLVVMTCNIGQRNQVQLTPFVKRTDPDIVVLQDAPHRAGAYARQYPDRHVQGHGEFVLISRLPIRSAGLVEDLSWKGHPVVARFELDWQGEPLVVYGVHLPTPRRELSRLMGLGVLKEWARARGWFGTDPTTALAASLTARVELARALHRRLLGEDGPVIVAGDLNTPQWGRIYRILTAALSDAYGECGRGCGFTFPGTSRNPLTLFGPWLRLDYILCNRGLRPLSAEVEPASRAQHRALVADVGWAG